MWSNKSFLSKYFWSASLYWKLPSQSAVKNLNTVDYLEVLNPLYSKAFILADNYLWHCSWSSATLDRWLSFCFWITHLVNDFQMRRVNAAKRELKEWLRNQSFTHGAYFLSFIYMNWFPRDQSVTFSMFPPVLWINFSY